MLWTVSLLPPYTPYIYAYIHNPKTNKQNKQAFDVVLVVEQFSLQGPSLLLQEALGVPDLWLGHARTNSRPHNTPPPEIVERMKLDNAIDIELHQFATEYSLRMFKELNEKFKNLYGMVSEERNALLPIYRNKQQKKLECLKNCRLAKQGTVVLHRCINVKINIYIYIYILPRLLCFFFFSFFFLSFIKLAPFWL
jgi:hypothetical protein